MQTHYQNIRFDMVVYKVLLKTEVIFEEIAVLLQVAQTSFVITH